ncbi:MAG: IPExxxVDY family protein [Bacteroidales bacterium]|nr:IPExxxVDY family protein [Bacteroidales bacterium]
MEKKNVKLSYQPDFDFQLLGLASRENDYKLSWAINKALNINLSKSPDLEIKNPKFSEIQSFSVYSYFLEEREEEILLISNRCAHGYLIEELKNIDFFLLFRGFNKIEIINYSSEIKLLDELFAVLNIDVESLKSKQKFIF